MLLGVDVAFHTNCVTTNVSTVRTVVVSQDDSEETGHDEGGAPERLGS